MLKFVEMFTAVTRSTGERHTPHGGSEKKQQRKRPLFHVPASPHSAQPTAPWQNATEATPLHTHRHPSPLPPPLGLVRSPAAHATRRSCSCCVSPRLARQAVICHRAPLRPCRRPAGQRRNLAALDQLARARLLRPLQESVAELGRSVALAHGAHLVGEHCGVDGDGLVEHGQHRLLDLGARVVEMYE